MRYDLLRQDARRDYWNAVFVDNVSPGALRAGLPIDAPDGPARVTIAPDAEVRSDFLEQPCPLVSDVMRRALDGAGVDNVQYFPAQIVRQYEEDDVLATYWLANVVGAVACATAGPGGASSADSDEGADDGLPRGFRVDPVRARGFGLFRLAEDRTLLVVSERVANALRAADLRGIVLQPPEEYNGRPVSTAPPEPGPTAPNAPMTKQVRE